MKWKTNYQAIRSQIEIARYQTVGDSLLKKSRQIEQSIRKFYYFLDRELW